MAPPAVCPLHLCHLPRAQETAAAMYRLEAVLCLKQGMALPQPLPLPLNVAKVVRVMRGHLLPVVAEMPFDPVLPLQFQVELLHLLQ